jgi:hypothetical protein
VDADCLLDYSHDQDSSTPSSRIVVANASYSPVFTRPISPFPLDRRCTAACVPCGVCMALAVIGRNIRA